VRSIVGRFLEHTRVLYFRWGDGPEDEALYLSSADWMSRNMFGRIEVAWPVRDPALRQRVIDECLVPYLHDAATPGCSAGWPVPAHRRRRRSARSRR
jgi:polyphosphate kinase